MGRLGFSYVEAELTVAATATIPGIGVFSDSISVEDDTTDFAYGLGVWLAPTDNLRLRLEYEMTSAGLDDLSDEDVDLSLISLSAVYRVGL